MRRQSELGPMLAIVLGALSSAPMARALGQGWHSLVAERGSRDVQPVCSVAFEVHSTNGGWAVEGDYAGTVRLVPEGLVVDLHQASTVATDRDADVRGVVLGLAEMTGGDSWSVARSAEPVPVGRLQQGTRKVLPATQRLIPDVGPEQLAQGWLVVEHVLEAPDVTGGTAWTYLHADRQVLSPLLAQGCPIAP